MRRLHGALTALALAALAGPAGAAEISRVATSGEPGNVFDLDLGVRWDRSVERATISRESAPGKLRYARTRNAIVPRIAVGLWHDLEAHFEMPYVLGDDREWRYGQIFNVDSGSTRGYDPLATELDAAGGPCPGCEIFAAAPKATGYHGGKIGDLLAGFSWGIFNDAKDDTKPFWLVGVDLTVPTAEKWEPGKDRTAAWESPYRDQAKPGPFGEKIWKLDVYTTFSRRFAYVDPYVKAHARFAFKSASTYSNCDAVSEAAAATPAQANASAVASCAVLGSRAGAKLPFVAGLVLGNEFIPYEDVNEHQKVSVDFRLFADLTSRQRFYNELSDATGKLLETEGYLEVGGLVGLYLRASQYVQLQAQASLSTRTAHDLSGEVYTIDGQVNPNFDWRYDAPGRRFRVSEANVFALSVGGVVQF